MANFILKIFFLCTFSLCFTSIKAQADYTEINEDESIYSIADEMPAFPGGKDSLLKFIEQNLKFPNELAYNNFKATVYVSFVVGKKGLLENIQILRGSGVSKVDEEAKRLMRIMPTWKPGKNSNQAVRVVQYLPIRFES